MGANIDIKLSARLGAALDMLGKSDYMADIGSDHGMLAAAALSRGFAKAALASDISEASLGKARAFAGDALGMSFAVADGLDAVEISPDKKTAIAICGMGGELIAGILARGREKAEKAHRIVMQPMGGERELRQFLYCSGYAILDETVVCEAGRFYQLIAARYTGEKQTLPSGALPALAALEFGAIAYEKRVPELKRLLMKKQRSRSARMEKALANGKAPERLARELAAAEALLKNWEDETE